MFSNELVIVNNNFIATFDDNNNSSHEMAIAPFMCDICAVYMKIN